MGFHQLGGFFDYLESPFYLLSTLYHYRVLLPLQQQLPQDSLLMLLLRLAVKHQRTIQFLVSAVLLLPVVQCYTVMSHLLPKMRVVSDFYFQDLFFMWTCFEKMF